MRSPAGLACKLTDSAAVTHSRQASYIVLAVEERAIAYQQLVIVSASN